MPRNGPKLQLRDAAQHLQRHRGALFAADEVLGNVNAAHGALHAVDEQQHVAGADARGGRWRARPDLCNDQAPIIGLVEHDANPALGWRARRGPDLAALPVRPAARGPEPGRQKEADAAHARGRGPAGADRLAARTG